MEKELTWIDPKSASLTVSIVVFMGAFLFTLFVYLYLLVIGVSTESSIALSVVAPASISLMVAVPFLYTLFAYIGTYLVCCFYNWVAGRKGGIRYYSR